MPEYDRAGAPLRPEGYDMHETATCFGQAVSALRSLAKAPEPRLSLIVHDFGIVPGFYFSNTVGCDKLVVFDVLPTNPILHKPDSIYHALVHVRDAPGVRQRGGGGGGWGAVWLGLRLLGRTLAVALARLREKW